MEYQFIERIRLAFSYIYTKIYFKNARLIRYPSVVAGAKYMRFGDQFTTGYYCRLNAINMFDYEPVLKIGDRVQINDSVHIACASKIEIGDDCLIASRVFITDHQHGSFPVEPEFKIPVASRACSVAPVKICSNVWIGEGVAVMPGVTIGMNSIVGANSVVTKDIPSNSIAVGAPARVIKYFSEDKSMWISID